MARPHGGSYRRGMTLHDGHVGGVKQHLVGVFLDVATTVVTTPLKTELIERKGNRK